MIRKHWWLSGLGVRSELSLQAHRIESASGKMKVLKPGGVLNLVKRVKANMSHVGFLERWK